MTQTSSSGGGTRRHTYGGNPDNLAREVGSLSTLGSKALKDKWLALFSAEPPRQISRALMLRALAYRIQEKSLGGLKPATRRLLMQFAHDGAAARIRSRRHLVPCSPARCWCENGAVSAIR